MDHASDVEAGMRSIQLSVAAMAASGFCAYFAAKQLTNPYIEESSASNRALVIGGIGIAAVVLSAVYAMFIIYRGSMRTKMFAMMALLVSLGGGYGGYAIGWKKGGAPTVVKAF